MKNIKLILFLSLAFAISPMILFGQEESPKKKESYKVRMDRFKLKKKDFKKHRYLAAGGSLSFLTYFGDLAPANDFISTDISQIKPGVSAFLQYRYAPRVSIKAELLYGRLTGDDFVSADPTQPEDKSRYVRNLSFRNDIVDFSLTSQVFIFKNYLDYEQRKYFDIYFSGGISVFYHNPKGKVPPYNVNDERFPNFGEWVALRPLGTEGQFSEHYSTEPYSNVQISIPVGGGFVFKLNERLDFIFELNYRLLLTDYIDDVSTRYVDLGALDSEMAKSMADRSLEEYSITTGEKRDISDLEVSYYTSPIDGNRYKVANERGSVRGGSSNDTFLSTSLKISYVLNKNKSREN